MKNIEVYFSPDGGCTKAITKEIDGAKRDIKVQCYSFTSGPIVWSLIRAKRRGVKVRILVDHHQGEDKVEQLEKFGVEVLSDSKHAIAHNKVMVIDGEIVVTGSFNFTYAAEKRNAENLLIIRDKGIAQKYGLNWSRHKTHSVEYKVTKYCAIKKRKKNK